MSAFFLSHALGHAAVLREVYSGIAGLALFDLTNSPAYPSKPSAVGTLAIFFESAGNSEDNFGERLSGYLVPPQTGTYTFWISSQNQSGLFLSTSEDAAKKRRICGVTGFTNPRDWSRENGQRSALISLEAGQRYYVEAVAKQSTRASHAVRLMRWRLENKLAT